MDKIVISSVPMDMIDLLWDKFTPMINRVIEQAPNDLDLNAIKDDLKSGNTLLIAVSDGSNIIAVNILETHTYKTGHKVLYIPISGGERLDEWLSDFLDVVHRVAKDYECDEIRISGRKGWVRKLKEFGWYENHVTIGCKVNEAENVSRKEQEPKLSAV